LRVFVYAEATEVPFTPEQEAQLAQIASTALLQEDARFRAAIREGIAQADRGEFIEEEEEMNARLRADVALLSNTNLLDACESMTRSQPTLRLGHLRPIPIIRGGFQPALSL
jgi:hypothetical protein